MCILFPDTSIIFVHYKQKSRVATKQVTVRL